MCQIKTSHNTTSLAVQKIWKSRMTSTSLKNSNLIRATVFSVANYGSESWTLKKADLSRRVSWKEKKTNVWEKVGSSLTLRRDISNRKMRFFGHVMRHDCLEKLLIQGKVEGKWRRGRPLKGWMDDIKERTGLTAVGATRLTDDRKMWECSLGCHTCACALM